HGIEHRQRDGRPHPPQKGPAVQVLMHLLSSVRELLFSFQLPVASCQLPVASCQATFLVSSSQFPVPSSQFPSRYFAASVRA
ncbi:MAG: hypothetical protein ACRD1U_11575, partial [Vicinamibacterales bacterium]